MKKVLFVATVTKHINTFHIPYLKWFKEQGYEVHVASKGNENIEYCDKHFEIPFERFPLKKQNIKAYKQLKNIIDENKYEIIHCHTPVGGVLTRLAARKARKKYNTKVIYTAHGFHFYKGAPLLNWLIYYPIEKICSRWTDCLITITKEDYGLAKKKLKKIKQIEYVNGVGINTDRFDINITKEEKNKLRKELEIGEEDRVLSYVAELNKNKNQIMLFEVTEKLVQEGYKIKLLIIGDGVLKESYKKYVEEKELTNNVLILGKRNDIPQLLSITDIYVASSIREGLPVNIMEAMYMGLPIIAKDNRGHRELVENNINGYIINNCIEMQRKIEDSLMFEKKIKVFSLNNKKKMIKYTVKAIVIEMEKIYLAK